MRAARRRGWIWTAEPPEWIGRKGAALNILGIQRGHDAAAALLIDGRVVADAAEERFQRIKHCPGLPSRAIEFCLKQGELAPGDLDLIAVAAARPGREVYLFRPGEKGPPLDLPRFSAGVRAELLPVEHHLAHAASAYFTCGSPERFLVVTCDGVGDDTSVALWRGEAGRLTLLERHGVEASLGWFYSNVTEALGWWHGDGEGKTMGLAPYGDPAPVRGVLDGFHPVFEDGRLVRPHDFGDCYEWTSGGAMHFHLREAEALRTFVARHGPEAIAAEAQRVLEQQVSALVFPWLERENTRNLACAGGIFLNVKLNQRIWYSGRVDRHHVFPNPSDAGLAVGAALYAHHHERPEAPILELEDISWGPSFEDVAIEADLKTCGLRAARLDDPAGEAARLLAEGKIVGWFQGRMESGPRALGNRSILMQPGRAENKDVLNQRVKFREGFRPFCPSLPLEAAADYLERSRPEEYMITSFEVRPEKRSRIPAVVHVDGTVRPQTVRRERNPLYWRLLRELGERTGDPVVLNTSMNVRGEPIVCTPLEAVRCFYGSGMDTLVIGSWALTK